jgi:hypothetical protein
VLTYSAKADVGGKIAQLGSRLITSTSKKLAGQFFRVARARRLADRNGCHPHPISIPEDVISRFGVAWMRAAC